MGRSKKQRLSNEQSIEAVPESVPAPESEPQPEFQIQADSRQGVETVQQAQYVAPGYNEVLPYEEDIEQYAKKLEFRDSLLGNENPQHGHHGTRNPSKGGVKRKSLEDHKKEDLVVVEEHEDPAKDNMVLEPLRNPSEFSSLNVMLRVRPLTAAEQNRKEIHSVSIGDDKQTVLVKPVKTDLHNASVREMGHATFKFAQVFDETATQQEVFEYAVQDIVQNVMAPNGKDGLVFAYGATNAGKTYTIYTPGEDLQSESRGMLVRSVEQMFRAAYANELCLLTTPEDVDNSCFPSRFGKLMTAEQLKMAYPPELIHDVIISSRHSLHGNMEHVDVVDLSEFKSYDAGFVISYLEIYNEQVYDLLDPEFAKQVASLGCESNVDVEGEAMEPRCMSKRRLSSVGTETHPESINGDNENKNPNPSRPSIDPKEAYLPATRQRVKKQQQRGMTRIHSNPIRKVLKLREGPQGRVYVENANRVLVSRIEEVAEILQIATLSRQTAETNMNTHSSRSHTIFTIQIILQPSSSISASKAKQSQTNAIVRELSIVDLAGSERVSRTHAQGLQLKEAAQINTSLMNLSRCLEAMVEKQRAAANGQLKSMIVPFRNSRLTRLFQTVLCSGIVTMLAAISPAQSDADETIHALQCSALAAQVKTVNALNHGGGSKSGSGHMDPNQSSYAQQLMQLSLTINRNLYQRFPEFKSLTLVEQIQRLSQNWVFEKQRVDELELEVVHLQQELAASESRAVLVEAEMRQELAEELQEAMERMEQEMIERWENGMVQGEERLNKRIEILTKSAKKQMQKSAKKAELETVRCDYYKKELDRRNEERKELSDRLGQLETLINASSAALTGRSHL